MAKISVIVPVYNCEAYITQCIESVLRQTFRDFELILLMMVQKIKARKFVSAMR